MNFYHEPTLARNYGYKGFHKRNYENSLPSTISSDIPPLCHGSKRTTRFIAKGIEKTRDAHGGLQYGSEQVYSRGRRFSNRTSPELIKLRQQQKLADEDIQSFEQQKLREREEAALMKRKDLEMLVNDYPWGKGSGGRAPRVSDSGNVDSRYRKQRYTDSQADSCETAVEEYNPFGRSGAGAPLKTTSGKCITGLQVDPDIRFQKQLKREVEQSLRYKDSRQQTETVETAQKQLILTPSQIELKLADKRKKELYAQKLDEQRNNSQERSRVKKAAETETESYNPWGRDHPKRDDSGKIPRRRNVIDSKGIVDRGDSENKWWLDGLRSEQRETRKMKHHISTNGEEYNPWGRPGGGAPIKTSSGRILTVIGKSPTKAQNSKNNEDVIVTKEDEQTPRDGHGLTLAEWIRKPTQKPLQEENNATTVATSLPLSTSINRKYNSILQEQADQRHLGYQKQKNERLAEERKHGERIGEIWPMSDISRKNESELLKQKKYYDDLQKLVEEKQKQDELVKQKEFNDETKHVQAFNQFWGRPGGGAPRINDNHEIDVSPRSYGALSTFMTHTGQHKFRRCN